MIFFAEFSSKTSPVLVMIEGGNLSSARVKCKAELGEMVSFHSLVLFPLGTSSQAKDSIVTRHPQKGTPPRVIISK